MQFDSSGLVMIVGKSGSGKSTLLNIASGLDKASKGTIEIFDKEINDKNRKYLSYLHREYISFLHQDYLLIENETVYYNISLPLVIKGEDKTTISNKVYEALSKLGFSKEFALKKCNELSGGEKQRVALLRSIISGPKILFMDEPTGAVDHDSKLFIMDIIKKISSSVLVIFVTHDMYLVNKYADRVITLKDGEIQSDIIINKGRDIPIVLQEKYKFKDIAFVNKEIKNNLIKKRKRNILRFISLIFAFSSFFLVIGFNFGASHAISSQSNNILDIGVFNICKQDSKKESYSIISLIKTSRPSEEETLTYLSNRDYYRVGNDYSYLLSNITKIEILESSFIDSAFLPVYDFNEDYIDTSLINNGYVPRKENEILINDLFFEKIKKKTNKSPIGEYINISCQKECIYRIDKDTYIQDIFVLEKSFKITGVVEEFFFLNTPKIYYSYRWLDNLLSNTYLNNLSSYFKRDYSWKERIKSAQNNDEITSFSRFLFLDDITKLSIASKDLNDDGHYLISNLSLSIKSTLIEVVDAIKLGLIIFIVILFIGLIILLVLSSSINYLQDKKKIAISLSLGATNSEIENIYLFENSIISFISFVISLVAYFLFSTLINKLLKFFLKVDNVINITFSSLRSGMIIILFVIVIILLINLITTLLPIKYTEKTSLKEEIKNND